MHMYIFFKKKFAVTYETVRLHCAAKFAVDWVVKASPRLFLLIVLVRNETTTE